MTKSRINNHKSLDNVTDFAKIKRSDLQQIINTVVRQALEAQHLENAISDSMDMSDQQEGMSKKMIKKRITVGTDANGKPIQVWVSGRTDQEVFERAARKLNEHGFFDSGNAENTSHTPLFERYARDWFRRYKKPKVSYGTAKNVECNLNRHLIPFFGNKRLGEITTDDVQDFFLERMSLSKSTCQKLRIYLNEILNSAVEDDMIKKNPAKSSRITYSKTETIREALTPEEAQDVANNLHKLEGLDRLMIGIPLFSGVRRGEMLALKWDDFNFDKGYFSINRAIKIQHNKAVIGEPKSKAGYRNIPITSELRALLQPYRQLNGYIFIREDGGLYTETTIRRAFERIGKKIDLHGATLHALRHTFITTMFYQGVDEKTMQAIAGHADIQTTKNRYTHARDDRIMQAADKLEGMYHTAM